LFVARLMLVVIFSRRGQNLAGSADGLQDTLSRLAARPAAG